MSAAEHTENCSTRLRRESISYERGRERFRGVVLWRGDGEEEMTCSGEWREEEEMKYSDDRREGGRD